MILRNDAACAAPAERRAVAPDGHQRVFNHHVYEYRKGLRDLALQTLPRGHGPAVIGRLDDLDIAYLIYPAGRRNVNVFFGAPECLEIVRRIGKFDLSRYTPEEDFILGIMLGYGRRQQCTRYLDLLAQGGSEPERIERTLDLRKGASMRADRKTTRGFTLIELLVVISIVAVLMAVLLPGLRAAKDRAQRIVCASQLRQLAMAHTMYQQSHEGWIVPATQNLGVDEYWYNTLGPYFEHRNVGHAKEHPDDIGRDILRCPLDKVAYPEMLNPHCMENPQGWLSYALNSQPTRHVSSRTKKYAGAGGNKITQLRRPADTMLHCDFAFRAWVCDSVTLTRNQYASEPGAHYDEMPGYPEQNKTVQVAYRHARRMNVLWVDGHVSLLEGRIPSAHEKPIFWGEVYGQFEGKDVVGGQ